MVEGKYLLKKFLGKGGWTYAEIPEIARDSKNPFGWVQVSGKIDAYHLQQYKLMPMGNGRLFLPVKAEIRKKIKKEAGDWVEISLVVDASKYIVPDELIACLKQESDALVKKFELLPEGEKKAFIDWIYNAKSAETRAQRIITMINSVTSDIRFKR